MKRHHIIAASIASLLGFLGTVASAETKVASLLELVPADAVGVIHVKNAGELPARLEASPLGAIWKDEKMREFFKPAIDKITAELSKEGEEAAHAKDALAKVQAILTSFDGEVVASINSLPIKDWIAAGQKGEEPEPEQIMAMLPSLSIIGKSKEAGKFSAAAKAALEILKKQADKDEKATIELVTEKVEDVDTTFVRVVNKQNGKETDVLGYGEMYGTAFIAMPKQNVEDTIKLLKNGPKGESIQAGPLAGFREKAKDSDVLMHLNTKAILTPLLDFAEKEAPLPEQAQQMGISVAGIRRALGLDDLNGFTTAMTFDPKTPSNDMAILWEKQSGLLKLLAYKNGEMPEANFIPQKVDNAGVGLFSMNQVWTTIRQLIKDISPQVAMLVNQQLGQFEQQLGLTLDKDIFGNLDDRVISVSSVLEGKGPKGADFPQTDQVFMIGLKDSQAFEVALDKLLTTFLPNFGVEIDKGEFQGRPLNAIKMPGAPNPEQAAMQPKIEYSIGKNYFTLSIGKGEVVRRMFAAAKEPGKSLWDQPDVKAAVALLPKGYCALSYSDLAGQLHTVAKMLAPLAENGDVPVDFDKLPDVAHLRKLLGIYVGSAHLEKNGLFMKSIMIPTGNE